MTSSSQVFRVVVDSWPTPDGAPFEEQEWDWDTDERPEWMPESAPLEQWMAGGGYDRETGYADCHLIAPRWRRWKWWSKSSAYKRVRELKLYSVKSHIETGTVDWK